MTKIIVHLTYSKDNTDKASLAFTFANAGTASSQQTVVFLSSEGARLSIKGYADDIHEEGFKPLKELMDTFVENGGQIWVCSPCFKKRKLAEDQLVKNATIVGGAKVVEAMSQGASCISF